MGVSADPPPQSKAAPSPAAVPVLLLLVFLSLVGWGVVIPLMPFLATAFEAEAWQVTLMFSAYSAGQFVGELYWGRLSDRIGRKPVLLITVIASGLGYLALAYSPGIWIAIGVRLAAGFFSGNISAIQGYIVDVTPPEKLAGRLGLIGSVFGIGFVVGPALGGLMAHPDQGVAGFRPPLILAAGLCAVAVVGLLAFVRESRRNGGATGRARNPFAALGEALRHPILASAFGVTAMGFFASSAMWSVLGLWAYATFGWGPRDVGLVMACTGVASAGAQGLLSGMAVRRLGIGRTIVFGLLSASTCLFLMAAAPWGWLAAVLLTASVVGHALWQPAATTIVSQATDPDRQGAVLGAAGAAGALSRVAGPVAGGALFTAIGPWAPIAFAGLFMLPAAWLGWRAAEALKRANP
jgi:MFS family permease